CDGSPLTFKFDGKKHYFCSEPCLAKFSADPKKYLQPSSKGEEEPHRRDVIYTCPMHPEVRQAGPGVCPKCGMALEPEMPSLEEGENPELVDFRRRFWWTLPLTVAVFVLAMFGDRLLASVPVATRTWAELVLSTPVVLWGAW